MEAGVKKQQPPNGGVALKNCANRRGRHGGVNVRHVQRLHIRVASVVLVWAEKL